MRLKQKMLYIINEDSQKMKKFANTEDEKDNVQKKHASYKVEGNKLTAFGLELNGQGRLVKIDDPTQDSIEIGTVEWVLEEVDGKYNYIITDFSAIEGDDAYIASTALEFYRYLWVDSGKERTNIVVDVSAIDPQYRKGFYTYSAMWMINVIPN